MPRNNSLVDEIDDTIRRRMSDRLATKKEIIDALVTHAGFTKADREQLRDTPISVLETHAESTVPGAVKTDDGLVIDEGGDATANALGVDAAEFGTGSIEHDTGGPTGGTAASATDFTRSAYSDTEPSANEYDDLDVEDLGSGVIDE